MKKVYFYLTMVFVIQLLSCQKDQEIYYPIEPNIEFKNIDISYEMLDEVGPFLLVNLILDYTDGDSNLFKSNFNDTTFNCVATLYNKSNNIYELITNIDNPRHYLIQGIEEQHHTYNQGPITIKTRTLYTGELQLKVYYILYPFNVGDTVKYTVQIIDNDGNRSNIAEIEKVFSN